MLDATEAAVQDVLKKEAYPVLFKEYESVQPVYPLVFDTKPLSELGSLYGGKFVDINRLSRHKDRDDGEEIQRVKPIAGRTKYAKVHQKTVGFEISERLMNELMANGRLGQYVQQQIAGWGEGAILEKDEFAADILQKGTLTAGHLPTFDGSVPELGLTDPYPGVIYDGVPFFDTAHPLLIGATTYANHTVSLALSQTNMETVYTTMTGTNNVDDRGERIRIRPNVLVVPPGLRFTAEKILQSAFDPDSAYNTINAIAQKGIQPIVWDALTDDADAWWMGTRGRGVVFFDSGAPVLDASYNKERKTWLVTSEHHFAAYVDDWRYWYCANKAAS